MARALSRCCVSGLEAWVSFVLPKASMRDSSRSRSRSMRCMASSPITPSFRSSINLLRCAPSNSLKRRCNQRNVPPSPVLIAAEAGAEAAAAVVVEPANPLGGGPIAWGPDRLSGIARRHRGAFGASVGKREEGHVQKQQEIEEEHVPVGVADMLEHPMVVDQPISH